MINVIGATLLRNSEGINVIQNTHCTVSGLLTFSGNTSKDVYAASATTPGSVWIDITGAVLTKDVLSDWGAKLILRNCVVSGNTGILNGSIYYYDCLVKGNCVYQDVMVAERTFFNGVGSTVHLVDCVGATANVSLKYCTFKGMLASKNAIAIRALSTVSVKNCTIIGTANVGQGLCIASSSTIENCIFTNLATGIFRDGGTAITITVHFSLTPQMSVVR